MFARRPYGAVEFPQFPVRVLVAAAHGHAGRAEEGRRLVDEIRAVRPDFSLSTLAESPELRPKGASEKAMRHLREGLSLAGLPD